jgi:hypothetical protein
MSKLLMLAGGVVEPADGRAGVVSAYVVVSAGHASRLFKVQGTAGAPTVAELGAATTIDLKRFQSDLAKDLAPTLAEARASRPGTSITTPSSDWVCGLVRAHLKAVEGIDVT